ncbi:unnamed protein product [Bursaphelenchus xylophilus]|uniref:(pine wood nematode) hypothetical protein n=1 Tax=Bursaphelenchus xylophilus TaxID=6326 RepID=A0A1I7SGI8_BURXY|nr:unnamed protein product [Bursaphelenchus xylophilus]CAG9128696.1 unnamed protein product [Bursaphelenchus xylophilus]
MTVSQELVDFYTTLRHYHAYYEITLAAISLSLNGFVVYMAMTTRNRVMRSYCWVVLMSMFADIVYVSTNLTSMMVVEVKGGLMYFITLGPFSHYPNPAGKVMGALFLTGLYMVIATLGMQFVYRYYALCKTPLTLTQFSLIYLVVTVYCVSDAAIGGFIFDGEDVERTRMIQEHPMYTHNTPTYMIVDPRKPSHSVHLVFSQLIVVVVYVVVIYTSRKINEKLKKASETMSSSTRDAQRQLNRVMILQATYPAIIVGCPVLMATGFTQLHLDILWCGLYLVPSVSLIPIANSVTMILVIPAFRKRLLSCLSLRKVKVKSSGAFTTTDITRKTTETPSQSRMEPNETHLI